MVSLTAGAMLLPSAAARSEFDYPALSSQVQNLDGRVTNNEKDIKALQDNTNTPPATNHVVVPDKFTKTLVDQVPVPVENTATSQPVPEVPNTPDPHISVSISQ